VRRHDRVVVVSTASGLKFADFKVGYHEGRLADVPAPRWRNQPIELRADFDEVQTALLRGLASSPS
jgi:threonine synthase